MSEHMVVVRPADHEAVVVHQPPGTVIRVVRDGQDPREYRQVEDPDYSRRVVAVVSAVVWNGAAIVTYASGEIRAVRNGHHRRDRDMWHQAAAAVKGFGVVYVVHELQDWYGRQVWVATGLREETPDA